MSSNDNRIAHNVLAFPTLEEIIYMDLDPDCVACDDLLVDAVGKYINVTVIGELPNGQIEAVSTETDLDALESIDIGRQYLLQDENQI